MKFKNINHEYKKKAFLIDWHIKVHIKFGFKPETLYITIYIIDSYLGLYNKAKMFIRWWWGR